MLEIVQYPNVILTTKSIEVSKSDKSISQTISKLIEVTERVDSQLNLWLGMAAPQIGINKRAFILRRHYKKYSSFINPEIVEKKLLLPAVSRCYSVKGIYFLKRYFLVKVKYENLEGKLKEEEFTGPLAFVVQHEIDHLNGKLVNDSKY